MSLQIAVAHTGQRLDADPVAFSSVDALKHWISRATEIPPESQVLLTTQGKHVKLQALLTEVGGPRIQFILLVLMSCRRRSSSIVASFQTTPRQPYRQAPSPSPLPRMIRRTRSLTTPICEHGRPFSRPAATGRSTYSRNPTPCPAQPRSTSPSKQP